MNAKTVLTKGCALFRWGSFLIMQNFFIKDATFFKNATIIEVKIGVSFFIKMKGMMENELY